MRAKITVEFIMSNICNPEDLVGKYNTLDKMVRGFIKDEGLFGVVEDKYKVVKVEEIK